MRGSSSCQMNPVCSTRATATATATATAGWTHPSIRTTADLPDRSKRALADHFEALVGIHASWLRRPTRRCHVDTTHCCSEEARELKPADGDPLRLSSSKMAVKQALNQTKGCSGSRLCTTSGDLMTDTVRTLFRAACTSKANVRLQIYHCLLF